MCQVFGTVAFSVFVKIFIILVYTALLWGAQISPDSITFFEFLILGYVNKRIDLSIE